LKNSGRKGGYDIVAVVLIYYLWVLFMGLRASASTEKSCRLCPLEVFEVTKMTFFWNGWSVTVR
jgi:hypothetical protein